MDFFSIHQKQADSALDSRESKNWRKGHKTNRRMSDDDGQNSDHDQADDMLEMTKMAKEFVFLHIYMSTLRLRRKKGKRQSKNKKVARYEKHVVCADLEF